MREKLLVTFGCSWTYGVGVGYTNESLGEFRAIAHDQKICDRLSFRGLLSKNLGFKNINFSMGGSSNQRQIRFAKRFLFSNTFARLKEQYEIFILWGITSTARNELFDLNKGEYNSFFYSDSSQAHWPFPEDFAKFSYDHDNSIYELIQEIRMFNEVFEHHGIKYMWFDTFNHHDYEKNFSFDIQLKTTRDYYTSVKGESWPTHSDYVNKNYNPQTVPVEKIDQHTWRCIDKPLKNFLFFDKNPRDLLSLMLKNKGLDVTDTRYHYSDWFIDNDRISIGVELGLLNPHSHHPTAIGHEEIFKILAPKILQILEEK